MCEPTNPVAPVSAVFIVSQPPVWSRTRSSPHCFHAADPPGEPASPDPGDRARSDHQNPVTTGHLSPSEAASMTERAGELGGSFALGQRRVRRTGYGAMQLAGDGVFGPPRDRDEALRVLRAAVDAGVNHIDT